MFFNRKVQIHQDQNKLREVKRKVKSTLIFFDIKSSVHNEFILWTGLVWLKIGTGGELL
jgi:hypothetical protein